jgi:asparagine synthetase B (glutamine-hydrolysing)
MIRRDPHGLSRWFYHEASDQQAPTLRQLFANPLVPCRLDDAGVRMHLGLKPLDATATCFAGVAAVRPGCALLRRNGGWIQEPLPLPAADGALLELLAGALDEALAPGTALALGGGLDATLLLAVIRCVLGKSVPVFSLCPRIPGYSERAAIISTARGFAVEPELLEVAEYDFVAALPDCVRFAEVPLYNLHPVSKLLFARRLQEWGIRQVITGDGADQVFAGVPGWDYLPIVGALFDGAGVRLCCPFLHPRVSAWGRTRADPAKTALRELARGLLPASVAEAPKVPQLAPEMDLSGVAQPRYLEIASRTLEDVDPATGKPGVRVVTLALLVQHFPRLLE